MVTATATETDLKASRIPERCDVEVLRVDCWLAASIRFGLSRLKPIRFDSLSRIVSILFAME